MYPYRTPAPAPTSAPVVVYVPEPLTKDEAWELLTAGANEKAKTLAPSDADLIDDLATALRKAWDANSGLARYPVSDPVWGDLARVAIERVRAA